MVVGLGGDVNLRDYICLRGDARDAPCPCEYSGFLLKSEQHVWWSSLSGWEMCEEV